MKILREEPSRPWQEPVVEDDEEPSMPWEEPVVEDECPSGQTPDARPWKEPVLETPAPVVVAPVAAAPVAENSGMRVRETETRRPEGLRPASRKVEEVSEKPVMEKIDPKKLIIYDAILNPKFKD